MNFLFRRETKKRRLTLKSVFASVFLFIFLFQSVGTAVAGSVANGPNYGKYTIFLTLFGDPTYIATKEEIIARKRSGVAYKGPDDTSVKSENGTVTGIENIDIVAALDKTFTYPTSDRSKLTVKEKAELVYDAIQTSEPDAFLLEIRYQANDGETKYSVQSIQAKNDAAKPVINGTSFNIDYNVNDDGEILRQSVVSKIKFGKDSLAAKPGSTFDVSLWYCAAEIDGKGGALGNINTEDYTSTFEPDVTAGKEWHEENLDGKKAVESDLPTNLQDRIAKFKFHGIESCSTRDRFGNGSPYFKIGQTGTFTLPTTIAEATQQQAEATAIQAGVERTAGSTLPTCSFLPWQGGSIMGCVAQVLYYGVFYPVSFIAGLLGNIFDFFLGYSLDDASYRLKFVETAWKLVRDISNIFFIILMIWSGLAVVFGIGKVSYKQIVPVLIINALFINFSLFATRVVIDMSNITARLFYNQMQVRVEGEVTKASISGYTPISEAIVSAFNPQRIFENSTILEGTTGNVAPEETGEQLNTAVDFNADRNDGSKDTTNMSRGSNEYASYFALVTIIAILIMWGVAMMFWKTAFIFVGRVIGLYVAMIFSPFALLTRSLSIPVLGKLPISSGQWSKNLTDYAIVAPLFVFFLYIINSFLGIEFFDAVSTMQAKGFFGKVMSILIPMLIIYGLVTKAASIATQYAGEFGTQIQGFVNKATGLVGGAALGVATGGVALAGRSVGLAARGIQQKTAVGSWLQRNQSNKVFGGVARLGSRTLEGAQSASFDARNSELMKTITGSINKNFGVNLKTDNGVLNTLKIGSAQTKGGLKAYDKRIDEETVKKVEKVGTSFANEEDAKAFYASVQSKEFAKTQKMNQKDTKDFVSKIKSDKSFEDAAREDLEKQKKDGTIYGYGPEKLEELKKQKKKKWEEDNKERLEAFSAFEKKQIEDYGIVKDNDTLTQAMRLRYSDRLEKDSSTIWNTVRQTAAPLITIADAEHSTDQRQKSAGKYGKDKRKLFTKNQKVIEASEEITSEINSVLEQVFKTGSDTLKKELEKFKNSKGILDHTLMSDEERDRILKNRRAQLDADIQLAKVNVDDLKILYKANKSDPTAKENYVKAQMELSTQNEEKDNLKNIANRYRLSQEKVEKLKGAKKPEDSNNK